MGMAGIYRSPLRVYLVLTILTVIGLVCAYRLPVSLFPNSSKPAVTICVGTTLAPDSFLRNYGEAIENQLRAIRRGKLEVEKVVANYRPKRACFDTQFQWGGDPDEATREMNNVAANLRGFVPEDSRDKIWVYSSEHSQGFFVASFYSPERSLTELYKLLEPIIVPRVGAVHDAQSPELWNPQSKQILVELRPEALASFELMPQTVTMAIGRALESYGGGSLTVDGGTINLDFPRAMESLSDLKLLQIPTSGGRGVSLGDIARVDLTVPLDSAQSFKTSGTASLILQAVPRPGGNVKAMAEDIKVAVEDALKTLPRDIQYRVIVDPSEFIRSAITNVGREVAIAAGLAVFVLFLFVGNLKNVATAAIEIPLSLILAFILMRLSGMNLNLISLGGLALSAGMNVDASVVVMENIFRHFEEWKEDHLNYEDRLKIIVEAVSEVRFAVIASTMASLVVFLPLAFTSDLSYAILGDLAKAVVFSHGFSALVALILVPTIRLQLMKHGMTHEKPSLLEAPLQRLEAAYASLLGRYLEMKLLKRSVLVGIAALLALLIMVVVPKLPREVIGKPDTDWLIVDISTVGNTLVRQQEVQTDQIEQELMHVIGPRVAYTFTEVYRNDRSDIMFRLKDKTGMTKMIAELSERFPNTPLLTYNFDQWNPAELPLPDPPDFRVAIKGTDPVAMSETAREFSNQLQEAKLFPRVNVDPHLGREESLILRPRLDQWTLLANEGVHLSLAGLADLTRTATGGQKLSTITMGGERMAIFIRYPDNYVTSPEELGALPIGVGSRIVPLKALASIRLEPGAPPLMRENGRAAYVVSARGVPDQKAKTREAVLKATELVERWERKTVEPSPDLDKVTDKAADNASESSTATLAAHPQDVAPVLEIEDPQIELNNALKQLAIAVSLSVVLIFITMVFQFGSIVNSLLVLVAVPLGLIGVLISLYVFKSSLSLNSMLGVILLNGLAVANSIILVDFLQKKVKEGIAPKIAAVEVARVRLRPILMTSLTTGLGMLPIAFGHGEGGKILQPLGIAVAGGLCFSMVTTLFIVPALQVGWIEWRAARNLR